MTIGFTLALPTRLRYCGMKMDMYKYNSLYNKRRMMMSNTDKRYQKSETPILDDEDAGRSYKAVQELWVARQPDWQEGVQWDDCYGDVQNRYYEERRKEIKIRKEDALKLVPENIKEALMAVYKALNSYTEETREMDGDYYMSTHKALCDAFYKVARQIPESDYNA